MNDLQAFIFSKEQFRRARLPSLYSDFQAQQSINPDGYTANISAWESALGQAAFAGKVASGRDRLSIKTGQELLQDLETKEWGRPMALGAVIYDAVSQGQMMPSQIFLNATDSIRDRSWKTTSWKVITWSLKQLGLAGTASKHHPLRESHMILLENLEIVKLGDPQNGLLTISNTDESIASLQLLITDMIAQQSTMASRIAELSAKARSAVSAKNKSSAMSALRSKKNHEILYKARSDRLSQLEEIYLKLVEALDQVEVVKVMQESTTVLRDIHQNMGGVEMVEDVVEGLREELNKVEDINNVIGESVNAAVNGDEIDSELQELEAKQNEEDERKRAAERQKELESLPPVPKQQEAVETKSTKKSLEESGVTDAIHRLSIEEDEAQKGTQAPELAKDVRYSNDATQTLVAGHA